MLKKLLQFIGCIIALFGLWKIVVFFREIRSFDNFGLGYFTGSLLLFLIGLTILVIGRRKKANNHKTE